MKNWKDSLRVSSAHLVLSLVIAALAGLFVFFIWYPYPYREVSGGRDLFFLVIAVDVIIGPLITLIIFNRKKSPRELMLDFSMTGMLQLAALGYGVWTVFIARPVHLVFEYSRLTVVHAVDIDSSLLSKAPATLRTLPTTGPTIIALRPFKNAEEQFDVTMAALGGTPLAARSDLWQPYEASAAAILQEARPASELYERFPTEKALIDHTVAMAGRPISALRYLPMLGRKEAWTALIDPTNAKPVGFLPLDPF